MLKLIDFSSQQLKKALPILLCDRTTNKNIIWATNAYNENGYTEKDQIVLEAFYSEKPVNLQPRARKSQEEQLYRTRSKAEVFTPSWICNQMNNFADSEWFGKENIFNTQNNDNSWTVNENKIEFSEGKTWQDYVQDRRLEITCGEAPYLVSRYDTVTSDYILPISRRIGLLDRKLRIVNENTNLEEEWQKWATCAFKSCYGYEFQGDSLLIARINLFLTFIEYFTERWTRTPEEKTYLNIADIISWNIWQMDGFSDTVPFGRLKTPEDDVLSLFGDDEPKEESTRPCIIKNWKNNKTIEYKGLKGVMGKMGKKKLFDFVIGNPPYNNDFDESGENKKFAAPVYNIFMDSAFQIANKVELITPARFLFNAGSTPKPWNKKILEDTHFKVLHYEPNPSNVFLDKDIKGGVAISYRNSLEEYKPIILFCAFNELETILNKVTKVSSLDCNLSDIIFTQTKFDLSTLYFDHPEYKNVIGSNGQDKRFRNNIFDKVRLFTDSPINKTDLKILGLVSNKRVFKYIAKKYVDFNHENLELWKVLVPRANGSGALGEVLTTPLIGEPLIGYTQSFIGIGRFNKRDEAEACLNYVKTKFARVMLGILKVTQDNDREVWKCIPLQDFTEDSDIDWSKSIHEIDLQLYKKYGLDKQEINFIESHVKEMN